jgi:transposase
MARYGERYKQRVVARMLPPESTSAEQLSREVGIGADTLERWRKELQSKPARERVWTAAARLEAVIATAALDEAQRSAWCREKGIYLKDLEQWRASASTALAQPEEVRASPQETRKDKQRIKELERELQRKEKALAEAAALLILSKKVEAIFRQGEDE